MRDHYSKTDLRVNEGCEYVLQGDRVPCNLLKDKFPLPVCISGFFFSLAFDNVDAN